MADVFIAVTRPEIIPDNWPPKGALPVSTDRQSFFPPTGVDPILRSPEAIVLETQAPPSQPISNNTERHFIPAPAPISNDGSVAIYARDPAAPVSEQVSAPAQNQDVRFFSGVAAISNDLSAGTIYERATPHEDPADVTPPEPGVSISNERNVTFALSPNTPTRFASEMDARAPLTEVQGHVRSSPIPMNVSGDTFIAPAPAQPPQDASQENAPNENVQILPRGGVLNVNLDRTIGGGGDPTKMAGSNDVTFGGNGGIINTGHADVTQAPSADATKIAGNQDVTMAPASGSLGNQEAYATATGDPTNNRDFNDYVPGAVGKPLKRNVT